MFVEPINQYSDDDEPILPIPEHMNMYLQQTYPDTLTNPFTQPSPENIDLEVN